MRTSLPTLLLCLSCAPLVSRAREEAAAVVQTFAGEEMAGQPLALTVNDSGHVFLSCTGRAFGRGVPEIQAHDLLRQEDEQVLALADRADLLARWRRDAMPSSTLPPGEDRVICLTDSDRDGRADLRVVTAGEFHDPLDGPAGGILALPDGGLLFGCTPSLWRLEDDNRDLHADRRLALLTGFGIRTGSGGPGLRAMAEGPDGMVYFTTSDRGSRTTSAEGDRYVLEGTGGVWRCQPDGSALELIATGLSDPAGIVVDLRGRVFVTDTVPGGDTSRLLRVLPGADFSTEMPGLEAGIIKARVTGMIVDPGVAATTALPALLIADGRPRGGILPVALREEGNALRAGAGTPLWDSTSQTGLAAAPDGSVLWAEWDRGFTTEATARILRMAPRGPVEVLSDGALLLHNGIATLSPAELQPLLEHGHPLVRRRACGALARLGFQESLDHFTRTARRSPSLPARLQALWGIATLARVRPMLLNEVLLLTGSAEPDIRALAVHIIGETSGEMPVQELLPLLRDPSRDVREEVAVALGRLRPPGIAEEICTALHQCGDSDPALRQALTFALSRIFTPAEAAARASGTTSAAVKSACLSVLIASRAIETADFLNDDNPETALKAGRAIYDRRIVPGYAALAATLTKASGRADLRHPELVRRALAAAQFLGDTESAGIVAEFAAVEGLPAEMRKAALEALTAWDHPPAHDAITGRWDSPLPRVPGIARPFLQDLTSGASKSKPDAAGLAATFSNTSAPEADRAEALTQLATLQSGKALELARSILPSQGTPALRIAARAVIIRYDAGASYNVIQEALLSGTPQEAQAALQIAQRFDSKQSTSFWLAQGKKFAEDKVPPVIELEVWEGLQLRDTATRGPFRRLLEQVGTTFDDLANPLARWRMCEAGGDPDKGRRLFEAGRAMNCTACHSLNGRGGTSAPELDHVASRLNRSQLLGSLVQPSALIAPGCGQVTVALEDGNSVSGILRKRDDTSLLLATTHGFRRLNAENVKSISTPVSAMPPAASLLTLREIRDLVAWLESLK